MKNLYTWDTIDIDRNGRYLEADNVPRDWSGQHHGLKVVVVAESLNEAEAIAYTACEPDTDFVNQYCWSDHFKKSITDHLPKIDDVDQRIEVGLVHMTGSLWAG